MDAEMSSDPFLSLKDFTLLKRLSKGKLINTNIRKEFRCPLPFNIGMEVSSSLTGQKKSTSGRNTGKETFKLSLFMDGRTFTWKIQKN